MVVDEMNLQKGTQFHIRSYAGATDDNELLSVAVLITGLKYIYSVIKSWPEVLMFILKNSEVRIVVNGYLMK